MDLIALLRQWLDIIVSSILIVAATSSLVLYSLYFAREAKLEKIFKRLAQTAQGWFPYCTFHPPEFFLVSICESKFSILRLMVRELVLRITHWKSLRGVSIGAQKVLVTERFSEAEQQVAVALECVARLQGVELLDLDFLVSLRQYLAYKHAKDHEDIMKETKEKLRANFESCSFRDKMVMLDDPLFSRDVIAYPLPPSETRPRGETTILADIILPLIRERAKELDRAGAKPPELEKEKDKIMTIINDLIHRRMGVVFVGEKSDIAYKEVISTKLKSVGRVMVSARGSYIYKLILIIDSMEKQIFERDTIAGEWIFYDTKRPVPVLWIIVEGKPKSRKAPAEVDEPRPLSSAADMPSSGCAS